MPAAAVIPAPTAYINVVAVKKLVVRVIARTLLARHVRSNGRAALVEARCIYCRCCCMQLHCCMQGGGALL